jgi:hypothetical protein
MPARGVLLGYTVHVQRPTPSKGVNGHVDVASGGKCRLEALGEFIQQEVIGYVAEAEGVAARLIRSA